MNQRDAFVLQPVKNELDMRLDVLGIVASRQTADPAIEQLNRLRPALIWRRR